MRDVPPPVIELRAPLLDDLPILFSHQQDLDACAMAAFPSRTLEPFMAQWAKIMADPANCIRTILCDGVVAGNISSYGPPPERCVGYWIGREFWGRGIATAALQLFIEVDTTRPLYAFVAKHNGGSLRVLAKCGFVASHSDLSSGIDDGVEELTMVLESAPGR